MRFEKSLITPGSTNDLGCSSTDVADEAEVMDDFSWAYDADGGSSSVGSSSHRSSRLS